MEKPMTIWYEGHELTMAQFTCGWINRSEILMSLSEEMSEHVCEVLIPAIQENARKEFNRIYREQQDEQEEI